VPALVKNARIILIVGVVALVALFGVLSFRNSTVVTSVAIRLKDGVREHQDRTVLGVGKEHQLPDYRVKLHVTRRFLNVDLGTHLNTSATNWIEFSVKEVIPLRHVQEVLIIEDDKVVSDALERLHIAGEMTEGKSFHCRLTTERSFEAGMNWFFNTPVGKAVSFGIALLVVLLAIALLRRAGISA
jgi:hypothetical protein